MMMSGPPITHAQAKALAKLISELRPDWDEAGVMAALGKTRERPVAGAEVCHAAIRAAMSAHNRTPAVIPLEGPHWQQGEGERRTSTRPTPPDRICRTCGQERPRCEQLSQLGDDGHAFDPLTGPPPNLDRRTGELVKPPPGAVAELRQLFGTATAETRERGRLPEVPERTSQEEQPAPPAEEPAPVPEPTDTTEGDS